MATYSIGKVKVTTKKTSSYANVRQAIAAAKSGSKSSSIRSSSSPQPVQAPAATSQAVAPKTNSGATGGTFSQPFFSMAGQKERFKNVAATFKAILPQALGGDKIYLLNPKTGIIQADVTIPVKGAVVASAAYAGYGLMAAGSAPAAATGAIAAKSSMVGGLSKVAIGAGVGFLAGSLLGSRTNQTAAPQSIVQQPTAAPTSYQISEQIDRSYRPQRTDTMTINTIRDSPYAGITSSPVISPSSSGSLLTPSQSIPISQGLNAEQQQQQSAGSDWLIPALIVGAALIFSKR